jgi:hypothetical protein
LAKILQKAAENYSNKGIIYIQSNGSEVFQSYQQLWEERSTNTSRITKAGFTSSR